MDDDDDDSEVKEEKKNIAALVSSSCWCWCCSCYYCKLLQVAACCVMMTMMLLKKTRVLVVVVDSVPRAKLVTSPCPRAATRYFLQWSRTIATVARPWLLPIASALTLHFCAASVKDVVAVEPPFGQFLRQVDESKT
jgi:hypothetical protein